MMKGELEIFLNFVLKFENPPKKLEKSAKKSWKNSFKKIL